MVRVELYTVFILTVCVDHLNKYNTQDVDPSGNSDVPVGSDVSTSNQTNRCVANRNTRPKIIRQGITRRGLGPETPGPRDQLGNELRVTCRASLMCLGRCRKGPPKGAAVTPRDTKVKLLKLAKTLLNDGVWPTQNLLFKKMLDDYHKEETKATATLSMKLKSKVDFNNIDLSVFSDLRAQAGERLKCLLWRIMAIEKLSKNPGSAIAGIDGACFKPVPSATNNTNKALKVLKNRIEFLKDKLSLAKGKTDQAINRKGLKNLNPREIERTHLKSKSMRDVKTEYRKKLNYLLNNPVQALQEIIEEYNTNNLAIKLNWVKQTKNTINVNNLTKFVADPIKRVYIPKPNGGASQYCAVGIPTIRDRGIQMLLKLVLEPIMEPLGDNTSFGFRPGRNCHQAVSYLANRLMFRSARLKKTQRPIQTHSARQAQPLVHPVAPQLKRAKLRARAYSAGFPPKSGSLGSSSSRPPAQGPPLCKRAQRRQKSAARRWCSSRASGLISSGACPGGAAAPSAAVRINPALPSLLDCDICFDNISHEWLISNVPFPKNFEALFVAILKAPIIGIDPEKEPLLNTGEHKTKTGSLIPNSGVPQGGMLSPMALLLMNWALDGIENLVSARANPRQFSPFNPVAPAHSISPQGVERPLPPKLVGAPN